MHNTYYYLTTLNRALLCICTGEETRIGQGGATATVATISTLLVVLIVIVGICITVQVIYKLANRKKRQAQLTLSTSIDLDVLLTLLYSVFSPAYFKCLNLRRLSEQFPLIFKFGGPQKL